MGVLKGVNSGLSFLLELAVLAAVGSAAFTLTRGRASHRWAVTVAAVVAWGIVWALFGAPGATVEARGAGRVLLEALWFGSAAGALLLTGRRSWAVAFVAAYALNTVLRVAWHQV